jgi:hypothetical protein
LTASVEEAVVVEETVVGVAVHLRTPFPTRPRFIAG